MSSIGERLRDLRIKQGLTQAELAQKLGLSRGQVSKIESDVSNNITAATLASYMKVFSTSADFIITGENTTNFFSAEETELILSYRKLSEGDRTKISNFISIASLPDKPFVKSSPKVLKENPEIYSIRLSSVPVLGKVAAGLPIEAIENILTFVETELPDIQFALYAKGDSMEPTIHDGDVIFVHRTPELENGEIGIFKIDDEVTCKIYHQYPDRIELHSINPEYSPLIYLKDSLNSFQILGKVVLTDSQKRNFVR